MNTARIVVLTIALGAGGVAAYLASGSDDKPAPAPAAAPLPTVDVLVAKSDIGLGQSIKQDDLQWQTWPAGAASSRLIRRSDRPAGEPILEQKLVKGDGSGFMAAILPTGMRAISTEISPETGAGGFILPNDHVDVILSRREKNPDHSGLPDIIISTTILSNVRVLAIDQTPKEKDGQNVVVGKTVTLELKPEQAEALARARQTGTLSLALRSITDLNAMDNRPDEPARDVNTVNVIRFGIPTPTTLTQR
jgi:pilus assembly protein CpaB